LTFSDASDAGLGCGDFLEWRELMAGGRKKAAQLGGAENSASGLLRVDEDKE